MTRFRSHGEVVITLACHARSTSSILVGTVGAKAVATVSSFRGVTQRMKAGVSPCVRGVWMRCFKNLGTLALDLQHSCPVLLPAPRACRLAAKAVALQATHRRFESYQAHSVLAQAECRPSGGRRWGIESSHRVWTLSSVWQSTGTTSQGSRDRSPQRPLRV